jgi:L-aminopeptidase/D-esterase-like protein
MNKPATTLDKRILATAGHWTDPGARTGCTVVMFDQSAPAVVDVRGGAPGTRETALLGPGDLVQAVDAILLTGGSAFGLEAAGGVMAYLRERDRGLQTSGGPVPIVPAAVLFDLGVGSPIWPTAGNARAACEAAVPLNDLDRGLVGAGTGATTSKAFALLEPQRGGLGVARVELNSSDSVTAIVAVNAVGQVITEPGLVDPRPSLLSLADELDERTSTTLAVVIVDAPVDRRTLTRCAVGAHDAFARVIRPCHTIYDGDVVFAVGLATDMVASRRVLAYSTAVEIAVERAIIDAVTA